MQGVTGPERQSVLGLAGVLGREAIHSSLRLRRGQALGEAGPPPHTLCAGWWSSDGPETAQHLGLPGAGSGGAEQ